LLSRDATAERSSVPESFRGGCSFGGGTVVTDGVALSRTARCVPAV